MRKGESIKYVLLVSQGVVKIMEGQNEEEDMNQQTEFSVGTLFSDTQALLRSEPHTITIKAKTSCVVFRIESRDFLQFLNRNPGIMVLLQDVVFIE